MKIGLIGATNVGKSTLFNKLIGNHRAIVTDIHGTTRDILYEMCDHRDLGQVTFLDTPGLDTFDEEIPYIQQVIDSSDVLIFLIDSLVGFGAKEQSIYALISQSHKKSQTVLVVNKLEKPLGRGEVELAIAEYRGMGFDEVVGISAKTLGGIPLLVKILEEWKEAIDAKEKALNGAREDVTADGEGEDNQAVELVEGIEIETDDEGEEGDEKEEEKKAKVPEDTHMPIAILGKPNAGKSTLLNQLLGEARALVSEVPGTTLDYNVGNFNFEGQDYRLYDTAGIKKKGKIVGLERIAYSKTISMLKYVRPMVILMIDLDAGITHRDMSLLGEVIEMKLPVIVCGNKIDLFSKKIQKEKLEQLVSYVNFAKYIPILGISAEKGTGVKKLFKTVHGVWKEYSTRISTADLNTLVARAFVQRPPRFPKNKVCKIRYISQVESKPPTFLVSVNNRSHANFAFKKWLDNTIRLSFGFVGIPLRIKWKDDKAENPFANRKRNNYG